MYLLWTKWRGVIIFLFGAPHHLEWERPMQKLEMCSENEVCYFFLLLLLVFNVMRHHPGAAAVASGVGRAPFRITLKVANRNRIPELVRGLLDSKTPTKGSNRPMTTFNMIHSYVPGCYRRSSRKGTVRRLWARRRARQGAPSTKSCTYTIGKRTFQARSIIPALTFSMYRSSLPPPP